MTSSAGPHVIVVGGGPVGAVTTLLLAQAGVLVTMIERETGPVLDYRASTFHPPTLDLLEESGATAALISMGLIAPTMQIRDRQRGKIAEFDLSLLADETAHPYRLQCEQFKLVDWAYGQLASYGNATLLMGRSAEQLRQTDEGVTIALDEGGERRALNADYVIACDGGRSTIRRTLGIDFPGLTFPEHFLVAGTQFDFRAHLPDICSVNYTADPVEWFLLLQIPDMWRIVLPVQESIDPDDAIAEERLQQSLQDIHPRAEGYDIQVRAVYRVHQRVAERYRLGRVFLAGDAAHLNNPLGGMGLNGGLHDAISLVRKLVPVLLGEAGSSSLDAYEAERRPEAINAINAITARNKRQLEERDSVVRERNMEELRRVGGDPLLARNYLLDATMLNSVRRCGLLPQTALRRPRPAKDHRRA